MSTLSIKLRYRPLRIGWCVENGDFDAFRQSARRSFSLWGGRFNPIIPIDDPEHARRLIDLFRVDCLYPASGTEAVKAFIESQKHLPWPDYNRSFVMPRGQTRTESTIADLLVPLRQAFDGHFKNNPQADPYLILHDWSDDDPLRDVLLATFGGLPPIEETAEDYRGLMQLHLRAEVHKIVKDQPVSLPDIGRMSLATFNRTGLQQHYAVTSYWNHPGFYVGDATCFDDLVEFWNLRATDIPLVFYDPAHVGRLNYAKDQWLGRIPQMLNPASSKRVAIWSRDEQTPEALVIFGENLNICRVDPSLWNGLNVKAPIMFFGEGEVLASLDNSAEPPSISFSLPDSPMKDVGGFSTQQYVVSVDPGIGLFGNDNFTLHFPFLPELNEFYGRNAFIHWNKARAEPDALGVVVGGTTLHLSMRAIDNGQLFAAIFSAFGIRATPSAAGLVCSRLIRQMGGIDKCRVFRIGGVRDLIEQFSPDQSFTTSAAKQIIRAQNTDHPLSDYQDLYIEQRKVGAKLTNDAILAHLLRKEIFRPGLKLDCPNCQLDFWRSVDDVKAKAECEYCGHLFHIGPQLRDRDWAYRRSGLFGRNDNQEGSISVVLTLQQLANVLDHPPPLMGTAMSMEANGADIRRCETDFVFLSSRGRDHRLQLAIGECKTRKEITEDDVQNLLRVAKAFPTDRFDVFIVFAKLAEFSEEELQLISAANEEHMRRVIILTHRELEPWFIYERTAQQFEIDKIVVDFEGMANVTDEVFFESKEQKPEKGNEQADSH